MHKNMQNNLLDAAANLVTIQYFLKFIKVIRLMVCLLCREDLMGCDKFKMADKLPEHAVAHTG